MKKIITSFVLFICIATASFAQSVSVNTDGSAADASSIFDVKSTTKGMLVPRMTTAQRLAILSPATGLLVFDTDTKTFWFYSGLLWTNISTASGGSFTLPYNGSTSSSTSALGVTNTGNGAAIEGSGSAGAGVYGNSFNGAGVNALSTNGFGLIANSTNSSAIYGFNANATSAIKGVNTVGDGVRGQSSGNGVAGVSGISTAPSGYGVWGNSNTGTGVLAQSSTGTALEVNGNVKIAGGNTNPQNGAVLTSDASGNAVWKNNRIAFGISGVNSNFYNLPNDTYRKVQFAPTDFYDFANNFNLLIGTNVTPTSSAFVAPVAGVYHFDASVEFYSVDNPITVCYIRLIINHAGSISKVYGTFSLDDVDSYINTPIAAISKDVYLQPGDIVHVEGYQVNRDGTDAGFYPSTNTFFNGHLLIAQ